MKDSRFKVEKKDHLKIVVPTVLSLALFFLVIFGFVFPSMQEQIMNNKKEMLK